MAAGMVNISGGGGQSSCRYILRERECIASFSNIAADKKSILSEVGRMEMMEILGNTELGIRGRHDAKRMTKLIVSLPNEMGVPEMEKKIRHVLRETGISGYPFVVAIHRGEDGEEGVTNRHAHINYFERNFEKGNSGKNRAFHAKDFVQQVTRAYQGIFGLEAAQEGKRKRLPRQKYGLETMGKEIAALEEQIKTEKEARNERFRERLNAGRNDSGQAQRAGGRTGVAGKTLQAILSLLQPSQQPKTVNLSTDSQNLLRSSITTLQPLSETLTNVYDEITKQNALLKNVPTVNELQRQISSLLKENGELTRKEGSALAGDAKRVEAGVARFADTANMAGNRVEGAVKKANRTVYAAWAVTVLLAILSCTVCIAKLYDRAAVKQQGADEQNVRILENYHIFPKAEYTQDNKGKPWVLMPVKTDKGAKK